MFFGLTDEQTELRGILRRVLERAVPPATVLAHLEEGRGHDPELWRQLAQNLEVVGLTTPVALGGSGSTLIDVGVVLSELGRALYPGPYLATAVLTAETLLASEDIGAQEAYLPDLAGGSLLGAVAGLQEDGLRVRPVAGGWRVSGAADHVVDGDIADLLVLFAHSSEGLACLIVDLRNGAKGVERTSHAGLDGTRRLARLTFSEVSARRLEGPIGAEELRERACIVASAGIAAEQLGGAQRCLELAVSYARERTQFGRPIGSFQAVKHRCADVMTAVEAASWASLYATWRVGSPIGHRGPEATVAASMAKSACSDAFCFAASSLVQVQGGLGFTWDSPAHLYLRRAYSTRQLFGSSVTHQMFVGTALIEQARVQGP